MSFFLDFVMLVTFVSLILNLYFFLGGGSLILNKYLLSYSILYSSYTRAPRKLYKLQALQNLDPLPWCRAVLTLPSRLSCYSLLAIWV